MTTNQSFLQSLKTLFDSHNPVGAKQTLGEKEQHIVNKTGLPPLLVQDLEKSRTWLEVSASLGEAGALKVLLTELGPSATDGEIDLMMVYEYCDDQQFQEPMQAYAMLSVYLNQWAMVHTVGDVHGLIGKLLDHPALAPYVELPDFLESFIDHSTRRVEVIHSIYHPQDYAAAMYSPMESEGLKFGPMTDGAIVTFAGQSIGRIYEVAGKLCFVSSHHENQNEVAGSCKDLMAMIKGTLQSVPSPIYYPMLVQHVRLPGTWDDGFRGTFRDFPDIEITGDDLTNLLNTASMQLYNKMQELIKDRQPLPIPNRPRIQQEIPVYMDVFTYKQVLSADLFIPHLLY